VGKFDLYKIPLKDLSEGVHEFNYTLDDEYFKKIDSPEIQKGQINVSIVLKKTANLNELKFELEGIVLIPCDRCLDDMEQAVSYKGRLFVKFGADFSQEDDEVVVVPESEGEINVAWFLYEFIVLSLPVKHVHLPGKCNKVVYSKLKKHLTRSKSDEFEEDDEMSMDFEDDAHEEPESDPRWDGLKNLIDND
jgi:uncharacterized metal-binding protein YceD (DUF177 family)